MLAVFGGEIRVDYFQFYVETNSEPFDYSDWVVGGQVNGLCGAVAPGHLHLTTGTQYGEVELTVEVHDEAPPLGDEWEDVVEVSLPTGTRTAAVVHQWNQEIVCEVPLRKLADYRVRYSAVGMDAAGGSDRYLLQFWLAPQATDAVLRQTSHRAAYWHRSARSTAPPPVELVEEWAADRELDRMDADDED